MIPQVRNSRGVRQPRTVHVLVHLVRTFKAFLMLILCKFGAVIGIVFTLWWDESVIIKVLAEVLFYSLASSAASFEEDRRAR